MDVKIATDVGLVRELNEDAFWAGRRCFVVCDGMGGHSAGEVASALAVQAIKEYPFKGISPEEEVQEAINKAQDWILKAAEKQPEYSGMGTTVTLAYLTPLPDGGAKLTLGHVGDSRGYVFTDGKLTQLTTDHSVVGELLRAGMITEKEAKVHLKRHVLTQALGSPGIEIEVQSRLLTSGSVLLLCTDGLTDVVDDTKIAEVLGQISDSVDGAQTLVDLANELGGPDNITVLIVGIP